MVCLGGGAGAEIVALAAALGQQSSLLLRGDLVPETVSGVLLSGGRKRRLDLRIFDAAPWECVLDSLADGLGALFLPEDKKEKEKEEDDEGWEVGYAFHRVDLLSPSLLGSSSSSVSCSPVARDGDGSSGLLREALRGAGLVTLFFTLNELYASSVARTTGLLLALGDWVEQGGRMCVVDSAGSYAVVSLGESEGDRKNNDETKRYPMAWMLDHTLLELAGKDKTDGGKVWKKVLTDESRWFRRDKTCDYPLQLEDMRYQVHIYEKL